MLACSTEAGSPDERPCRWLPVDPEQFDPPAGGRACHVTVGHDGVLTAVGGERFSWINPELMVVDSAEAAAG